MLRTQAMRSDAPLDVFERRTTNVEAELLEKSLVGVCVVVGASTIRVVDRELRVRAEPGAEIDDATPENAGPAGGAIEHVVRRRASHLILDRGGPSLVGAELLAKGVGRRGHIADIAVQNGVLTPEGKSEGGIGRTGCLAERTTRRGRRTQVIVHFSARDPVQVPCCTQPVRQLSLPPAEPHPLRACSRRREHLLPGGCGVVAHRRGVAHRATRRKLPGAECRPERRRNRRGGRG